VYRAGWRSEQQVQDEIAALLHLGRKNLPVALPVAARDGAYTWPHVTPEGAKQVVLFIYAAGEPVHEFNEPICRRFGQTLADLHTATDDFTQAPVRFDREHLLDLPLRALEPLLDDRPDDRTFLQDLARGLRERLAPLPEAALAWGYCHGDFRPANAHWDRDSDALTLFDFEASGLGFRGYDLGTFCFRLIGVAPADRYEALSQALQEGYAERRPLSDADRDALPLFLALRPIRILGCLLQTAHKNWDLEPWRPPRVPGLPGSDFFDETLQFLREWAAEHELGAP
jgi:Ser/Thr protein kinase RdoA (MazF antagonist)